MLGLDATPDSGAVQEPEHYLEISAFPSFRECLGDVMEGNSDPARSFKKSSESREASPATKRKPKNVRRCERCKEKGRGIQMQRTAD